MLPDTHLSYGMRLTYKQFHKEKGLTSVLERYENEVKRVLSVIELQLTRTGNEYLVGDKVCYADLMFVSWKQHSFAGNGRL